jgi:hypothetical protein
LIEVGPGKIVHVVKILDLKGAEVGKDEGVCVNEPCTWSFKKLTVNWDIDWLRVMKGDGCNVMGVLLNEVIRGSIGDEMHIEMELKGGIP